MADTQRSRAVRGSTTGRAIMVLFDALGRRGALRIIWELRDGRALTFRALVEACDSNPGVLNTRLKELRSLRLVEHGDGGYRLSEQGLGLIKVLGPLNDWAKKWADEVRD